jgi:hypothetical protein
MERNDRERTAVAKHLPDALLCCLLGWSGLGWGTQSLMAPSWLTLYQQPDKICGAMAIREFFQDLGEELPAFSQFENTLLFDHIANIKLASGSSHEKAHHGLSLLALSMRSFTVQEQE